MNFKDTGTPIFKVMKGDPEDQFNEKSNSKTSQKMKRNKKTIAKDVFTIEDYCKYCCKPITKPNQARHIQTCSVLKGGGHDKKNICCINSKKNKCEENLSEYKCEEGEYLQHIPNHKQERDCLYIAARSGSGKSYYCAMYATQYSKLHPKNPIYLFSGLGEEKGGSIDKIKKLIRINLDEEFMSTEFELDDIKNCMLIFDDIDVIENKALQTKLYSILNMALKVGRHAKCSVLMTMHSPCDRQKTKTIIEECHSITIFPHGMGSKPLKYLLDSYFGMNKKEIEEVKKLDSRWVTITRTYPSVMFWEGGAKVL